MTKSFLFFAVSSLALISACGQTSETAAYTDPVAAERVPVTPVQADDSYYVSAKQAVDARLARVGAAGKAKNVILFIGDGMGISTVTAGRIYAGQVQGLDGESYSLAMDTLPNVALSRTYAHDSQVSDSAATATAMVAGVKTDVRTLGLTQAAAFGNCATVEDARTQTLFELAETAGLSTGVISTARLTHATPASTYAYAPSRDWEADVNLGDASELGCKDIAAQLIDWPFGDGIEFAMGGGRRQFMTADMPDKEVPGRFGARKDGRDLVQEWDQKSDDHRVVFDRQGFDAIDFSTPVRALGLFEESHMQYELDRPNDIAGEPSIAEMTEAAITRLSQDEDGYVLMVEGGRIDHAHHGTNAARALADTKAFDDAIATALALTGDDTLIIVTADHSHTLTIAGYPQRNNPILGKVAYPTGVARAGDGKPYTTLSYANGSTGCRAADEAGCLREDLSEVDTTAPDFQQQTLVFMPSETHAGEDVAIFAKGPGSELVNGVMEQNELFHVMGRSLNLVE